MKKKNKRIGKITNREIPWIQLRNIKKRNSRKFVEWN